MTLKASRLILLLAACTLPACAPGPTGSGPPAAPAQPPAAPAAEKLTIRPYSKPKPEDRVSFEVVGLAPKDLVRLDKIERTPEQWTGLFSVYTIGEDEESIPEDRPPIAGTYKVEGDALRF